MEKKNDLFFSFFYYLYILFLFLSLLFLSKQILEKILLFLIKTLFGIILKKKCSFKYLKPNFNFFSILDIYFIVRCKKENIFQQNSND